MNSRLTAMMLLVVWMMLAGLTAGCAATKSQHDASGKNWLKHAKYGLFLHYLVDGPDFNKQADSFDVKRFADQVEQSGADYVIFTVGQNGGYFCTPNDTYEKYAGYARGQRCTRRDVPMEAANELTKRNIRFLLYSSSRSPQFDPQAVAGLADLDQKTCPPPQEFIKRWDEVITEWSKRYGTLVSGWWFDGTYQVEAWADDSQPYNFHTWAAACRAGNPDSVLAFNMGTNLNNAFRILTPEQDYTAGEQDRFGATPSMHPPYPGKVWHIASFLGQGWGNGTGPTYNTNWLIDYVRRVNQQGGVVSIDLQIAFDGTLYPPNLAVLKEIKKALK